MFIFDQFSIAHKIESKTPENRLIISRYETIFGPHRTCARKWE